MWPVPAGWYSTPVWKTALGAGAGVLGGMLIFDALFSPGFGDPGIGYGDGFRRDEHGRLSCGGCCARAEPAARASTLHSPRAAMTTRSRKLRSR